MTPYVRISDPRWAMQNPPFVILCYDNRPADPIGCSTLDEARRKVAALDELYGDRSGAAIYQRVVE